MATEALTGVRVGTQLIDLDKYDDIAGDLSILRHVIDTAINIISSNSLGAESLLEAALIVLERGDERFQAAHNELCAIRSEQVRHA